MANLHPWRGIRPWTRHSLLLLVAGLIYVGVGGTYLFDTPPQSRTVALQVALKWLPFHGWGVVFVGAGLLTILSSRWPPISATWGYTVLTGLSAGWAAFFVAGVMIGDSPRTNLSGALVWGLLGFMWWVISGFVDPKTVKLLKTYEE